MKNPFEDIDRDALDPARQPPGLSLWLVALGVLIPTAFGVLMASGHAPPEKIRAGATRVATLNAKPVTGNGGTMIASVPKKPDPIRSTTRSSNLGIDPEDIRKTSIVASTKRAVRPENTFKSVPATTIDANPSAVADVPDPTPSAIASIDRPKQTPATLEDFFGPAPVGSEDEDPFARPDFAGGGPRGFGRGTRGDRDGSSFGAPRRPVAPSAPEPTPEPPDTSIYQPDQPDEPDEPDDVEPPDIDPGEDIVATIRRVRSEVEKELNKNFPLFKVRETVSIRNLRRQTYSGKVGAIGNDYLILLTRSGSERIPFNQLEGTSRIRCDKTFRNDQVLAETRKRMTE